MKSVLYVTYDGLTDPLGRSQVIPYMVGLAARGYDITFLSCEKPEAFERGRERVQAILDEAGIRWAHVGYTKSPPIFSTLWDLWRMTRVARRLHRKTPFDAVHCRTVLSALIGQRLKRRFGLKLIFDIRGLWADERVDGKLWNLSHPLYRTVYNFFKGKEKEIAGEADRVVALTERAARHLEQTTDARDVAVVPCCVDTDHFRPAPTQTRAARRASLGISPETWVLGYLGSLGTRYMLDEMMRFFAAVLRKRPDARFLFVNRHQRDQILDVARRHGVDESSLIIQGTDFDDVPELIGVADGSVFFIALGNSGIAVSPTKQAELMALGVPIVCNTGIGDCDEIVGGTGVGVVVPDFGDSAFDDAAMRLIDWTGPSAEEIRAVALEKLSLESGIERYAQIWEAL